MVIIGNIPGPWVRDVCQDHWTPEPIHQQPEKESVDISNSKATHRNELVIDIIDIILTEHQILQTNLQGNN